MISVLWRGLSLVRDDPQIPACTKIYAIFAQSNNLKFTPRPKWTLLIVATQGIPLLKLQPSSPLTLTGGNPSEDVKTILAIKNPLEFGYDSIWSWEKLPYAALRAAHSSPALSNGSIPQSIDVDEWILRNERWLRDHKIVDWSVGLVKWSTHSDAVFPISTNSPNARNIKRTALSGRAILNEMRPDAIQVQPSVDAFRRVFHALTGGLLDRMDWSNVFVAGGMILSTLSCIDPVTQASDYTSSDIDMYIYGLGPVEANAKISHIFDVWKSNLPEDAKDKTLVVRNSRTITFFSNYPIKRVQIVLKLVNSPKEVLLNFDLDICAMGWDGKEVWLLPRAARALESERLSHVLSLAYVINFFVGL
jgi:hypothetical protein